MAEEKPKSKLDLAFEDFERETADCKVIRKEVMAQLREDVKKMRPQEYDKATTIMAKMSVVNTLRDMLKDIEDSSLKMVKMRMSRTEQEHNGQYSQAVIELLKMVRADDRGGSSDKPHQTDDEVQAQIQARGKELNIEVSEGETQVCGGAPGESSEDPREKKVPEPKDEEKPKDEDKDEFKF